jgi:hypothetical protein
MIEALRTRLSYFRKHALALLHRNHEPTADVAARRERWNQVIAGRHKGVQNDTHAPTSSSGATGSAGETAP